MKANAKQLVVLPIIMLKVLWSGIGMVDGRGKFGGTVASKSRSGAYCRNKSTPVNRRSAAQQAVRVTLAFFSQGYRALSEAQRNTWITAANNGYTANNIFGNPIKKSGIGLYVGLNTNLRLIEQSALTEAPVQGSVGNPLFINPAGAAGANTLFANLEFDGATDVVPANTSVLILSTGAVSAGINFAGSKFRIISYIPAAGDTGTTNLNSDYEAVFGALVAGQKIFLAAVAINETTGQAGVLLQKPFFVAA